MTSESTGFGSMSTRYLVRQTQIEFMIEVDTILGLVCCGWNRDGEKISQWMVINIYVDAVADRG